MKTAHIDGAWLLRSGIREHGMSSRRVVIVAAILCSVGARAQGNSISSYFNGLRYDFPFTCEDLGEAPPWLERDVDPPLAPRDALRIARKQLDALVANSDTWRVNEVGLRSACSPDQWYYVVGFLPPPPRPDGGIVTEFRLVVLMNGRTTEPQISAWPTP